MPNKEIREKICIELIELVRRIGYNIHKKQDTEENEHKLINSCADQILSLFPTIPKEEEPQEKSGECECGHHRVSCEMTGCNMCHYCGKPIRKKEEKPKIEELKDDIYHGKTATNRLIIHKLVDKLNELIRNANKE